MPYITREDGVNFVIPSYRDVLVAKKSAVQKEIEALSQSYGEYITMQRKSSEKYELAFSPDMGYLLGETVWHHFNRPMDMIYCEALPDTSEAILVIVKGGNVYLDGSFPVDSIPEELVIFLTQQNSFEIYVYGDVPISEKPVEGKFSFDAVSVKSFNVLDQPVFKNLPLLKAYHLQLVETVLKEHGIGAFPVKGLMMILGTVAGVILLVTLLLNMSKEEVVTMEENPYQGYVDALASPAPDQEILAYVDTLKRLYTAPGWNVATTLYKGTTVDALMKSSGNSVEALMQWCKDNNFSFSIRPIGVVVSANIKTQSRPKPKQVYKADEVLADFIDNLAKVYPGNNIGITEDNKKSGPYKTIKVDLRVTEVTPMVLTLIAEQLKGLPFTLRSISLASTNQMLVGSIELDVLGN